MKTVTKYVSLYGSAITVTVLLWTGVASAHVVVTPADASTASFETFTVNVPNEKDIPTTAIKLIVPDGLEHVSPTLKPGWDIDVASKQQGEHKVVTALTWSNGEIGDGFRDEFTFSAKPPDEPAELKWKAYQTYSDGTVVAWDQAEANTSHDSNKGPFSVTRVAAEATNDTAAAELEKVATDAENSARFAVYTAAAGIVIGLVGVVLALRK